MPRKLLPGERPLTGAERQARFMARRTAEAAARQRRLQRLTQALRRIAHSAGSVREARQIAEWALLD